MVEHQADILVIGGGLAGIVTALELLEGGRSVLLIDRDAPEHFGGLARESFGGLLLVDTPQQRRQGIQDSPALALRDWLKFGELSDSPEHHWPRRWAEAYVQESRTAIHDWLQQRGVRFLPLPLWIERGNHGEGNSVPRWHITWGTGQGLTDALIHALLQHPQAQRLTRLFHHRVDALTVSAGRITGCSGLDEHSNQAFSISAQAVVVATGGINGNLERVRQHWPADQGQPPASLLNGSHRYADGRLHDAVAAQGGQVTHLDRMWNYAAGVRHWQPRKPEHGLSLVPPKSALWLKTTGERFEPPLVSGYDTRDLVTRICTESGGQSWQLLNRRIALKELAISGAESNPAVRDKQLLTFLWQTLFGNRPLVDTVTRHCPDVVTANTLPELVTRMNALQADQPPIQLATLQQQVAAYDAMIQRGPALHNDDQLRRIAHLRQWKADRLRTCRFQRILDPAAGPLIAIRLSIISRKSLGGIQTNLDSQVLDASGQPMTGLYATGEAAGFGGGGSNGQRALEGTFLGGCILTARHAARAILQQTPPHPDSQEIPT